MKTYIFIGRILPEREKVDISTVSPIFAYFYGAEKADIIGEMKISGILSFYKGR